MSEFLETADWLQREDPGIRESLYARYLGPHPATMDGAYLGLNGEPVIVMEKTQPKLFTSDNGIILVNPGVKKISRFIDPVALDRLLIIRRPGEPDEQISHIEAEGEGLLQLKSYVDISRYLGIKEDMRTQLIRITGNDKGVPGEAYQVTKEGAGKIFIGQKIISKPPIFMGGMRLKF